MFNAQARLISCLNKCTLDSTLLSLVSKSNSHCTAAVTLLFGMIFFFFFGGEGGWGLGESCSRIHERLILIPITKKIIKCTKNIVTWYSQLLNNNGSHKLKYFQVHLCSMYNRYWFSSILINGTRTMSLRWKEMNPMVQIWQHDCKRICTEPVMAV